MEVILAENIHLGEMCKITDDAKAQLKRLGTDQWQYGYPNEKVWKNDILNKRAWVAVEDGKVLGAFAFIKEEEISYRKIEGKWLSDKPYTSLHRVCVADDVKGRGVAGKMFAHGFEMSRSLGFGSVRIDTHEGNIPMQRAIAKSGFDYCGIIRLVGGKEDGSKRLAYEYIL
jgi:GNAT superfamily N-acetyltransferase